MRTGLEASRMIVLFRVPLLLVRGGIQGLLACGGYSDGYRRCVESEGAMDD